MTQHGDTVTREHWQEVVHVLSTELMTLTDVSDVCIYISKYLRHSTVN